MGKAVPANKRKSRQPVQAEAQKRRPASRLTVLVLIVLMAVMCIQILRMGGQIQAAQAEEAIVAQQLAELQEVNRQLQDDLDNSTDPSLIENIARDQLGMVGPGEKVFHISK